MSTEASGACRSSRISSVVEGRKPFSNTSGHHGRQQDLENVNEIKRKCSATFLEKKALKVKRIPARFCSSEALNLPLMCFLSRDYKHYRLSEFSPFPLGGLTQAKLQGRSFMMTQEPLEALDCLRCSKTAMSTLFFYFVISFKLIKTKLFLFSPSLPHQNDPQSPSLLKERQLTISGRSPSH